jgi:hypothetical protein
LREGRAPGAAEQEEQGDVEGEGVPRGRATRRPGGR